MRRRCRRHGKQGEVVDQCFLRRAAFAFAFFQRFKHDTSAGNDGGRQSGKLRNLHAIRPIGRAFLDFVQENHLSVPLLNCDSGIIDPAQFVRKRGHFVVVRGKERTRTVDVVQMFQRGPRDGQAVIGRGAAPDFIQDHQRAVVCLIEDRGGFDHFDHKRGTAPCQIVRGADTAENLADQADVRGGGRHVAAHLRHQGDDRILPQEGRLTCHVGTGQQPDVRVVAIGRQGTIVGNKRAARLLG